MYLAIHEKPDILQNFTLQGQGFWESVGIECSKHMQIFIKSTNINNNSPIKILVDFKKTLCFS